MAISFVKQLDVPQFAPTPMLSKQAWLRRTADVWEGATFLRKWGLVGVLIGIGAGLGVLKRFATQDVGSLPVVSRDQPERPVGLVTRSGLWSALDAFRQKRAT